MIARRLLLAALLVVVGSYAHSQPATVQITGPVYLADGSLANGSAAISWQPFTSGDHYPILAGRVTIQIVNGQFTVNLVPTTNAVAPTPGPVSYTVAYALTNASPTRYWFVPPINSPFTVDQVERYTGSVPPATTTQQQITLGAGLQVLLGFLRDTINPR